MSEDKSKLQLIGEIAQANNKNLELIEEINEKEDEIERLNNIINNAKVYIELLEDAVIKGEIADYLLLDTERQILEGAEIPDITVKYLKNIISKGGE